MAGKRTHGAACYNALMAERDNVKQWRPRWSIRTLAIVVTLVANLVWLWQRLEVTHRPGSGSRAVLLWQGSESVLWDTFPIEEEEPLGIPDPF